MKPAMPEASPPDEAPSGSALSSRSTRSRVHFILEVDRFGDPISRFVDKALVALIVLNVIAAIIQTDASVYARAPWAFEWFERLSMLVFCVEYVLRLWSCVENSAYQQPVRGRIRHALEPMMLLDLLVLVIPVYLDLRPLRILRLLRLGRYSPRLRLFARVIQDKRDELFVGLFVAVVLLIACSTAMYYVEGPDRTGFSSIPETMWWGVATLTTVGYGDVYPNSGLGKVLGSMVALLGVGVFALPAGILASGFSDALAREEEERLEAGRPKEGTSETQRAALAALIEPPSGQDETAALDSEGVCPTCGSSRP